MLEYMRIISDKILNANDSDLILLRWLISYHSKSFIDAVSYDWVETKREEMKAACVKRKIIENETKNDLPDSEYAQKIYKYGQSVVMKFVKNESTDISEYSILLYMYTLAINSTNKQSRYDKKGVFGKAILENTGSLCEKLAEGDGIKPDKDFQNISSVDKIILTLYLWVADFSILNKYNKEICRLPNPNPNPNQEIYADKIYKLIYRLPSKLIYFYNNTNHDKDTERKIYEAFKDFISAMPPEAVPFTPSIITIFFNSLLPSRLARSEHPEFDYKNLIREIVCENGMKKKRYSKIPQKIKFPAPNDSSFLKMLILPEDGTFIYDKNKKQRIETRFIEYEWEHFCKIFEKLYQQAVNKEGMYFYHGWHKRRMDFKWYELCISEDDVKYYEDHIRQYRENIRIMTPKEYKAMDQECKNYMIKAMKNHSFPFTYLYFEMFCEIAVRSFHSVSRSSVNIALSMIHLNTFTKWYDAALLNKGMDFSFSQCDYYFYSKILALYERYDHFIVDLSYVDREVLYKLIDKSMKKMDRKITIDSRDIFLRMTQFFYESAERKINILSLLDIFKENSADKRKANDFTKFNPIYKWIKLLDDEQLNETFFDEIEKEAREKNRSMPL